MRDRIASLQPYGLQFYIYKVYFVSNLCTLFESKMIPLQ
jgi:hypothetical protein